MAGDAALTVTRYGDRALLVEVPDPAAVAAVRAALDAAPLTGQRDLVPAACTVLVVLDRRPSDLDLATLRRLSPDAPGTGPGTAAVELPVVFDGEDLADVAGLTGRSAADVVATLTSRDLTVAFCG